MPSAGPHRNHPLHHARPRGSESARMLARRLKERAAGRGLGAATVQSLTTYHLDGFFAEQQLRIERQANAALQRVRAARLQQQRENERATRHEAIVGFDVESRGSCGSDVHCGDGGD